MGRISRNEIYEKGKVGVTAGFLGGIMILLVFVAFDKFIKLDPWDLYTMIGIAVGLHGISATIFGVLAHMLTAMTIGAVFCICSTLHPILHLNTVWKGILGGGVTGLEVYAIFFMPITLYIIVPDINSITSNANFGTNDEIRMLDVMKANLSLIMGGAIVLHVIYGAIIGIYSTMILTERHKDQKITSAQSD